MLLRLNISDVLNCLFSYLQVAQLARYRHAVRNKHLNEVPSKLPPNGRYRLPGSLSLGRMIDCCRRYVGQIKDSSDTHFTDYELQFDGDGTVRGSCRNHQRTCVVLKTVTECHIHCGCKLGPWILP